ncbi:FAD/NAD(P)-binding domain-containing protein [Neurospora tetrasperma FGSC 2509]|nr:FAD/NAD(P)-binding domain-containing protein [Neurospora tetrasperma FGSC 2509]
MQLFATRCCATTLPSSEFIADMSSALDVGRPKTNPSAAPSSTTSPTSSSSSSSIQNYRPRAAILGAGISGLSASISLRRAGWSCTIFERSLFSNETGAAITLPPNASLCLSRWGFDFNKAEPVPNWSIRFARADTLEVVKSEDYKGFGEDLGVGGEKGHRGSWGVHRADLHWGTRETEGKVDGGHGTKRVVDGGPVRIELGREVVGLDCEEGAIEFRDGTKLEGWDLVVVADAAQSTASSSPLTPSSPFLTNPSLRPHFLPHSQGGPLPGFLSWHDPIKDVLWVSYPCRGGRVLNNAIVHDTPPQPSGEAGESSPPGRGWSTAVGKEEVLKVLSGFHGAVRALVDLAYGEEGEEKEGEENGRGTGEKGIKVHHLFKRPALNSFVRGKAVVIGDAAHVMMPTHAAGGAIAIESAATMEVLFRDFPSDPPQLEEFVKRRLQLFDQLRIPRCNLTMLASNAGPKWLNVEGVEEEARRYYKGPLPHKDTLPWTKEFREVLFCYDAFEAAEEEVRKEEEAVGAASRSEAMGSELKAGNM